MKNKTVLIRYKNHSNVVSDREIIPVKIRYGSSVWHRGFNLLLIAYDVRKKAEREFLIDDIILMEGEININYNGK